MNEGININNKQIKKKKELSKLVGTFFRNALRSNLDLTSLADTKAGILISINGFILTVSVTASGFAIHNSMMNYAFISIIITSLGAIIFAVLAVKPRRKEKLVAKEFVDEYESLLYYQDMADLSPDEYKKAVNKVIYKTGKSKNEMISHLHILSTEIKTKYFWLTRAYTFFSLGLVVSASFIIYALMYVEDSAYSNLSEDSVIYKKDRFYNLYEPSGATTLPDGRVLVVEDEGNAKVFKLLEIEKDAQVAEIGNLYLRKKMKKVFKKNVEDLEGLASNGKYVYAITSHSLSKNFKHKKSREKFIMFTYDDGAMENLYLHSSFKKELKKAFPKIFKKDIFDKDTINIEGLSVDGKKLIIAFRGPLVGDKALLLSLKNPQGMFLKNEKPEFDTPVTLDLDGQGIRGITYDKEKDLYWIIAGSSSERMGTFSLWSWSKAKNRLEFIQNQPEIGFGEGITVVYDGNQKSALLIVEDNGKKPNKAANYIIIQKESL
ncbi:DUF3616 domain-containing protein [Sulfurimonas sp. SAG-AH-194-C20]|nr:DUF3616 domain-containing protein [Sulfurimonas sp. SAG-AH-194-C20]MDF1878373.1 DUF3616 domain-containing protein [Sulfurimonas sp. SAG-AH-194-C20]